MFSENYALVMESTEEQVKKQFSLINKNINLMTENIKALLPNVRDNNEKELFNYLNESMSRIESFSVDNTINIEFNNNYDNILNKINSYSYKYNTEQFNESLKLRNELIEVIKEDLSEYNLENGINVKNDIYKDINNDIEYFKNVEQSIFISTTEEMYTEVNFN